MVYRDANHMKIKQRIALLQSFFLPCFLSLLFLSNLFKFPALFYLLHKPGASCVAFHNLRKETANS